MSNHCKNENEKQRQKSTKEWMVLREKENSKDKERREKWEHNVTVSIEIKRMMSMRFLGSREQNHIWIENKSMILEGF